MPVKESKKVNVIAKNKPPLMPTGASNMGGDLGGGMALS